MMRKNSLFILLLIALLSLPAFAFADASTDELSGGEGVGWQGIITSGDDAGLYGAAGRSRNKYNMACWVMGKNPLTIADEVRSRLSNPNYGGRFYEYANTFESIPSWEYVPEWQPTYANLTYVLYGFDFQWESAVSQSLYEGAKEDFRRVLAGEDLSGGGAVDEGSYEGVYLNAFASNDKDIVRSYAAYNASFSDGVVSLTGGETLYSPYSINNYYVSQLRLYASVAVMRYVNELVSDGYKVSLCVSCVGRNTAECEVFYARDLSISYNGTSYAFYGTDIKYFLTHSYGSVCHSSDGFFAVSYSIPDGAAAGSYPSGTGPSYMSPVITAPFDLPTVDPGGDWPEVQPTPTPTPPEIPTPTAPTVTPDPTPTEPTPTWPVIPTPTAPTVVTIETPEGLDYTQLLTLINDNLNDINSYTVAINSSLNSLRSDLVTEFDGVTQGLRNIYQYLQHLDDLLERHCKHIRDSIDENIYELELYLKGLFEWLPQQLNFDAEFTYDDSSVVNWLKQIYAKLGGGTSAPNPVADPGGFFEWLGGLIAGFIAGIVVGLPGKLQELVSDITDLTEFFPFSAPWDIYAMLLLFAHDPVTPVFSIPWGLGSGNVVNVVVDCTQWDGVMTIVRSVEKIIFAGGLAKLTFNMFKPTDVMGD